MGLPDTGGFRPMTLARMRHDLQSLGYQEVMTRQAALAAEAGHNAVIAADFVAQAPVGTGALAGIPIGIKDNIDVAGFDTTGGSLALLGYRPDADAAVVAALRAAGAVLACKLNMHELAFGISSDNATFGRVFNPFDHARTAGGSSGGSGAAVARGIVPVALGTDTGGSVRVPASFCGVLGFRPSTGRYPAGGMLSLSHTRDTAGVLATNVQDIAEIDALLAGDATALTCPPDRPLRLGLPADALPGLSEPVEKVFRATLARLIERGVIELVPLPSLDLAKMEPGIGFPIVFGEAPEFWRAFCARHLGCDLTDFAQRLGDPEVRAAFADMPTRAAEGTKGNSSICHHERAALQARIGALYSAHGIDMLVMPTVTVQPPRWEDAQTMVLNGVAHPTFFTIVRNTSVATLIGAPSLSLPVGFDSDGLPVGLMLDGPPGSDRRLLGWAAEIERHISPTAAGELPQK